MPFVVAHKAERRPDLLLFSLSSVFSLILLYFFFPPSPLLQEIKPGPFAEAGSLPPAVPMCFVSKGQGSPA